MAQETATRESGRGADTPTTWVANSMSTKDFGVDNATGTDDSHRDLIATSEDRVIDANATHVRRFVGAGVVIFAQTFERTNHGLRFAGDCPIFAAAVESEHALRETLAGAGYRSHDVERALSTDHRLTDSRAEAATAAAGTPVVVTDGGVATTEPELLPGNPEIAGSETATDHDGVHVDRDSRGCDTCTDDSLADKKAARLPDGMVVEVCPGCFTHLPGRSESRRSGYPTSRLEGGR